MFFPKLTRIFLSAKNAFSLILEGILLMVSHVFFALDVHFYAYEHVLVEALCHAFGMIGVHITGTES